MRAKTKRPVSDSKLRAIRVVSSILIIGGFLVLFYVNFVDLYSQYMAEKHIQSFTSVYDATQNPQYENLVQQASDYNRKLAGYDVETPVMDYWDQLSCQDGTAMASYIEIPKISVKQPISHGTADIDLMAGVGHFATSSLPVGGQTSHCVLLGHSGMRNSRMFDDLGELVQGDEFVVWTMGTPYAYRVYATETLLPEEAETHIELIPDNDLVTLITCVPYGVNSHRLLVHAQRCDYDAEQMHDVGFDSYVNERNFPLIAWMLIFGIFGIGDLVAGILHRKRHQLKSHMSEDES